MRRTLEDYLKTILSLEPSVGIKGVRGSTVAQKLGVSRPTVSAAFKELENEGYLRLGTGSRAFLTHAGRAIAEDVLERHDTFERMLVSLGVDEAIAADDACKLEHAVSKESFDALKKLSAMIPSEEE